MRVVRAAGILLILLGQPYTRMVTMTIDDIITSESGQFSVKLPGGTIPLPHPFGAARNSCSGGPT